MVVLYQQLREFLHCELKGVGAFRLVIVCVQDVGQCVSSLLVHYKGWCLYSRTCRLHLMVVPAQQPSTQNVMAG